MSADTTTTTRRTTRTRTMDTSELAPMANTRETELVEDFGPRRRGGEDNDGVDDGFGTVPPTNGVPHPPSLTPVQPTPPLPPPSHNNHHHHHHPHKPSSGKRPLDVNLYATKKTVAQGLMDMALLTANANQLRYVLEAGKYGGMDANYYMSLSLISVSIIMQIIIGVALIFLGRYNVSREQHARKADTLNNWVVLGVFIITVINVFISSLSVHPYRGYDPVLLRSSATEEVTHAEVTEKVLAGGM